MSNSVLPTAWASIIISERAKRASSVMLVFNRDLRYVCIIIDKRGVRVTGLETPHILNDLRVSLRLGDSSLLFSACRQLLKVS